MLPIDAAVQSNLRETTTRVLASLTPREEREARVSSAYTRPVDIPYHPGLIRAGAFPMGACLHSFKQPPRTARLYGIVEVYNVPDWPRARTARRLL